MSSEVPRSGWRMISTVGTTTITAPAINLKKPGGMRRLASQKASMSGTVIFAISDGWNLTGPSLSHRCAPCATSPNRSTATSAIRPMT